MICSTGCTTVSSQRRRTQEMRERAEIENLKDNVAGMEARLNGIEDAQQAIYVQIESLQAAVDRSESDHRRSIDSLQQTLKAAKVSRARDQQATIDTLSERMAGIMQSQSRGRAISEEGYEHVVQSGETLSEIASAYNVRTSVIVEANDLSNPDSIRTGQTLFIPK